MNHPWLALFIALLNVNFGWSLWRGRLRRRERLWEAGAVALGIGAGVFAVVMLVVEVISGLIDAGLSVGQPELALTLAHFAAVIMVFVFGIVFIMSTMYFSDDVRRLLALPLRPRHIISAKFGVVLVNEYITLAIFLIPVYWLYAGKVPVSAWFYPSAVMTFLFTPLIPLILAALVVLVLMRLAGGTKRRDLFTVIGGLLSLLIAIGVQVVFQSQYADIESETDIARLLFERAHGLSEVLAAGYPPVLWAMRALATAGTGAGFTALLSLIAASVALFGAMLIFGDRVFIASMQFEGETTRRRTRHELHWRVQTPVRAVARAEQRLFLRTPVFVLNGLAALVLLPFVALLPVLQERRIAVSAIRELPVPPSVHVMMIAAWFALGTAFSMLGATAFSREGSRMWILRSLPLTGRQLFLGKLQGTVIMTAVGAAPGVILLIYLLGISPLPALLGISFGLLLTTFFSMIALSVDMRRPLLNWTEPARAVKSNLNTLIGMVLTLLLLGLLVFSGVMLWLRGLAPALIGVLAAVVVSLAAAGLWRYIAPRLDEWLWLMDE